MKDPKRYTLAEPDISYGVDESKKGEFVYWSDYARLKAENERLRASSFVTAVPCEVYEELKAEVERLKIYDYKNLSMRIEIDKLNAKINRLVKAGDKMVLCIDGDYNYQMPCVQAWNAAKDGKPTA
jgi:hypothetical protein